MWWQKQSAPKEYKWKGTSSSKDMMLTNEGRFIMNVTDKREIANSTRIDDSSWGNKIYLENYFNVKNWKFIVMEYNKYLG